SLSGTKTVAAVAGVAAFPGLSINQAGGGYTLSATAPGLTAATSAPFDITAALASALVFTAQPGRTPPTLTINPAAPLTARADPRHLHPAADPRGPHGPMAHGGRDHRAASPGGGAGCAGERGRDVHRQRDGGDRAQSGGRLSLRDDDGGGSRRRRDLQ